MNKSKVVELCEELLDLLEDEVVWLVDESSFDEYSLVCSEELSRAQDIIEELKKEMR